MRHLLALFFLVLFCTCVSAQTLNCYELLLNEGKSLLQRNEFAKATNRFQTALSSCDNVPASNPLDSLIQVALNAEIAYLNRQNAKLSRYLQVTQELAAKEAEARSAAEKARILALTNESLARKNEAIAILNGRRAASLRLSTLAELESDRGATSDAFALALLALDLSDDQTYAQAMRAFTTTVIDSFGIVIPQSTEILDFRLNGTTVNIITKDSIKSYDINTGKVIGEPVTDGDFLFADEYVRMTTEPEGRSVSVQVEGAQRFVLKGHEEIVKCALNLGPEGFVTAGRDNTLRFWSRDGTSVIVGQGHLGNIYQLVQFYTNEQMHVASRSSDGTVRLWQPRETLSYKVLGSGQDYLHTITALPNGVAVGTATGNIILYQADRPSFTVSHGTDPVVELRWWDETEVLLSRSLNGEVKAWSLVGEEQFSLKEGYGSLGILPLPTGRLVSWNKGGNIMLWSSEGEALFTIKAHASPVTDIVFHSATNTLISYDLRGNGEIWDAEGQGIGQFIGTPQQTYGKQIAVADAKLIFIHEDVRSLLLVPIAIQVYARFKGQANRLVSKTLITKYGILFWDKSTLK